MSDQALNEAVAHFRAGERAVGRSCGKLWSVFATACDVSEERYLKLIVARLATYLQIPGYGEALVNVNGWDMETLHAFRAPDCGQHDWRHRQRRQLHRARGNRAADSRTLATCRGRPQNLRSTLAGSIHRRR